MNNVSCPETLPKTYQFSFSLVSRQDSWERVIAVTWSHGFINKNTLEVTAKLE